MSLPTTSIPEPEIASRDIAEIKITASIITVNRVYESAARVGTLCGVAAVGVSADIR